VPALDTSAAPHQDRDRRGLGAGRAHGRPRDGAGWRAQVPVDLAVTGVFVADMVGLASLVSSGDMECTGRRGSV
jgi:hypothetical protein